MAVGLVPDQARSLERNLSLVLADPSEVVVNEVTSALRDHGVAITSCVDGADALFQIGQLRPDLVLVASTVPVVDVHVLVQVVRQQWSVPIIVGIAEGEVANAAKALDAGATACVARPYRLPELLPMLRSVQPVPNAQSDGVLEVANIRLDPVAHEVRASGEPVHLPLREFEVLEYLMRNTGRVVTPQQIRSAVWGSGDGDLNTVAVHVRRLRIKLGDDPRSPQLIRTIRGLGYRLAVD